MGDLPTGCRYRLALMALAGAVAWHAPAAADWSATLPMFSSCDAAKPPELPTRWRAVGLLMAFRQDQLDVGEFVYDGTLPAMRATVYGVVSGAVDILITEKDTYLLFGPYHSPKHCKSLGHRLRVPAPQWLAEHPVCLGESPIAAQPVQWWQTGGFDPARYWISTRTRLPWRSVFLTRSLDPAVIGDYAMSYFPTFTPLPQTNLRALRDLCAGATDHEHAGAAAVPTARELMAIPNAAAEAERQARIGELIPGLSHGGCRHTIKAKWPDRFVTTMVLTPIRFNDHPYSALMYYDWSQAETQLILPFQGNPPVLQGIISLKKRVGYRIQLPPRGNGACTADLPGIVRPDWMTVASCECRGVIDRNSTLGPDVDTQILSCPIKAQGQRVMWNWYTTNGQPIVFMEAQPEGSGVFLADYHDWLAGQTGQAADFALPNACAVPPRPDDRAAGPAQPTFSNVSCSDCHTTPW